MSNENCFRVCTEREIFRRTHLSGGGWSDTPKALICINKHCHGPVIYLKLPLVVGHDYPRNRLAGGVLRVGVPLLE